MVGGSLVKSGGGTMESATMVWMNLFGRVKRNR